MQILTLRERAARYARIGIMTVGVFASIPLGLSHADAIGKWVDGKVTRAPWKGAYTHIQVDDTRYTVMEHVVVRQVYTENGAEYKKYIPLKQVRVGNTVLMQVEGNRVYQIEKVKR